MTVDTVHASAAVLRAVADALDEQATVEADHLRFCPHRDRDHQVAVGARLGLLLELVGSLRTQAIQHEQRGGAT